MNTEIVSFNQATHNMAYSLITENNLSEAKTYIATLIGSAAATHPDSAYYLYQQISFLNQNPTQEDFYYTLSAVTNYLAS